MECLEIYWQSIDLFARLEILGLMMPIAPSTTKNARYVPKVVPASTFVIDRADNSDVKFTTAMGTAAAR